MKIKISVLVLTHQMWARPNIMGAPSSGEHGLPHIAGAQNSTYRILVEPQKQPRMSLADEKL